jgi:hypothetical protein
MSPPLLLRAVSLGYLTNSTGAHSRAADALETFEVGRGWLPTSPYQRLERTRRGQMQADEAIAS